MFNREDAHIANAVYVLNFKDVDNSARFQQAAAEKAFGGIVNGQSVQSNVPDGFDPTVPRIMFNSGTKQISISQASCQLVLNFPEPGRLAFDEQWEVIKKNVGDFHRKAMEFKPGSSYGMSSLVFQIAFRSVEGATDLNVLLYNKLIKKDLDGELASVSVQLGYRHDSWYKNVNVGVYEKRELKLPVVIGQQVAQVKMDKLPVTERGINLTIDVNDRPKFQNDAAVCSDPESILKLARDFSLGQLNTIIFDNCEQGGGV